MEGKVQSVAVGQKVLLFRVNMNVKKDAIEKHQEVLAKDGFCWFGKIGRIPMREKIEEVLKEKHPHMLLYTKQKLFCATLTIVLLPDQKTDSHNIIIRSFS